MRWVAQGLGAMTPPGGRHIHTQPVPRLGGLAIFGGALLALLATLPIDQSVALVRETRYVVLAVPYKPLPLPVVGILLGAAAITALGAIDDVRSLPGRVKFPLIYAAASIPVWFGMTTAFITHPVTGAVIPLGMAGKVFTVVRCGGWRKRPRRSASPSLCSPSRCLFWTLAMPSSGGTGTASLFSSRIGATCTIACWIAGCHSAKSSSCCGCCRPSSGSVGWP